MRRFNKKFIQSHAETVLHHFRLSILVALVIIGSFVLVLRLAYLQFSQHKRFATLSLKNQMSIIALSPSRGIILDRNGVVLANNLPIYVLEIIPERVKNLNHALAKLNHLIPSITNEDMENFNRLRKQNPAYVSIPLKYKLSPEEVATFASHQYQFPGVNIKAELMRNYPLGEITAHLLGYVGRISPEELNQLNNNNYRNTHFIGKIGIERFYESELHGELGYQQVETDASGRTLRVISKQNPIPGKKLTLTIDARLQTIAHQSMADKSGAVVVIDPRNGEILAMVSTPSYDPNLLVKGMTKQDYAQLSQSMDKPLYNRAIRGLYPPASPIKPFIALAGLEKGVITPASTIYDPGSYHLHGVKHAYRDWKRGGHGLINLKRAITVSCDIYFYQLGNKIGITSIEDMLTQFGFGQLTHVDLHEEASGLVPSPQWKRQTKGLPWYPGDTLITSIGQGFMLTSPLQLANATASLSLHGRRFQPHLLQISENEQGFQSTYQPVEEYPVRLKNTDHWTLIIEAMQAVISSQEGTGYRFGRNTPYSVAGKTGTAQVFSLSQDEHKRNQAVSAALRDHSLFIAFAPVENPEIAVAVIVEHDTTASVIARQIMDAYFKLHQPKTQP